MTDGCGDAVGTHKGYLRHRRRDEEPCDRCKTAHRIQGRIWQQERRATIPAVKEYDRQVARNRRARTRKTSP